MWFTMCICESYPSLCDPMDCSPPGSSVHGVLQARVLDWTAIPLLCVSIYLINLSNVSLQFTPSTLLCTHKNVIDKWILLQLLFKEVQRERMKNSMGHRELGVSSPGDSYVPLDWRSHLLSFGLVQFSSFQSLSHVQLFATPWTAAHQASLSITNYQSSPKLMFIEPVMPSNHLILCHPLLLPSIFPSIRVFSNESALCIRWLRYWSFSFNISPS